MFDTKTNLLSFVDPKLWPFKSWRYPKNAKISKAHNTAPRAPRAKKICISKFHPRGYLHAKNDQNRRDKGVKLLTSALECPKCKFYLNSRTISETGFVWWQLLKIHTNFATSRSITRRKRRKMKIDPQTSFQSSIIEYFK